MMYVICHVICVSALASLQMNVGLGIMVLGAYN